MDFILKAKTRNHDDNVKRLRKDGWIPGCVFGKSCEPINIIVSENELKKCIKMHASKLTLAIEGKDKYLVGFEELQRGPLQNKFVHVSFHAMNANEVASLTVPIEFVGKALGQMEGGILKENFHEITVKGLPADLPDMIQVDVSKLNIGDSLHVSDIVDQYNFEFLQDDHTKVLVSCGHPRVQTIETPVEDVETAEVVDIKPDEESSKETEAA